MSKTVNNVNNVKKTKNKKQSKKSRTVDCMAVVYVDEMMKKTGKVKGLGKVWEMSKQEQEEQEEKR